MDAKHEKRVGRRLGQASPLRGATQNRGAVLEVHARGDKRSALRRALDAKSNRKPPVSSTQKARQLSAFLAYLRSERGLSESTIAGYTRHLTQFLASLGPRKGLTKTTRQDVHHFLGSLDPALSNSTKASYFSALRQLYRFMQLDYNMRRDPMLGMRSPRRSRPSSSPPV